MSRRKLLIALLLFAMSLLGVQAVFACGGLFCQTIPVAQQMERIIFTINDDGTVSAYVQINYVGDAPNFSWVVPVPTVPEVDVAEISTFDELDSLTAPLFIPPRMPSCAPIPVMSASAEDGGGVDVLGSGTAGPYAYDIVRSDDPDALVMWLRENEYQVTEEMEPLIDVYTAENMIFLAMKLQREMDVSDIQPVVMTYEADYPTIPLRLTAVAATPNMGVLTWIFADGQTVPTNYAHPTVADENIRGTFMSFDGTNYMQLVDMTVDLYEGRAFITEYAMPTSDLGKMNPQDELLQKLVSDYPYVTRFFGRMSPEEMTVDPSFMLDTERANVFNVHDLSQYDGEVFWGCTDTPIDIEYDSQVVPADF